MSNLLRLTVIVFTTLSLAGCGTVEFFDQLGAVRTFKDANMAYGRGFYEEAIELYEEIIEVIESSGESELAEQLTPAYFYIANSYDNLYPPGSREREDVRTLEQAISYYELAAEEIPSASLRLLSMQYLVQAFGPDKANDPARSEPVLRQMILDDPENPDNYYRLAQLYEEGGLFEDAESIFQAVQSFRSRDPLVYLQLAGFYNRAGEFDLTIESLEQRAQIEPDNPEAYYTISTYYWEKAFRDFRITQDLKIEYIMAGLDASDRALALNDRYVDALVYKNILLRMQANEIDDDFDLRDELIAEADELRDMAEQLRTEQREGAIAAAAAASEGA